MNRSFQSRTTLCGWIFALALGTACVSRDVKTPGMDLMSRSQSEEIIDRSTQRTQRYEGLYNTLDVTATLRNSAVTEAQLHRAAMAQQWDRARLQAEENKQREKFRSESEVFVSFYTPERKNDDLNKSTSQWRVFLESNGRRWEGKVTKIKLTFAELQDQYPYHTRFATPYSVTFPVPLASVEASPSKLIITGPVGMAALDFSASQR